MSYVVLRLYKDVPVSLKERKKYFDGLYGDIRFIPKESNLGFLYKFSFALGFKPVEMCPDTVSTYKRGDEYGVEGYLSPRDIFCGAGHLNKEENSLFDFVLENKEMVHPNPKYTYHTRWLLEKFGKFLEKVYPGVHYKIVEIDTYKQKLKEYAKDIFFRGVNTEYDVIDVCFASRRLLSDKEIKYLNRFLLDLVDYDNIRVEQNYCETCEEYSGGESPYHIELSYN